MRDYYKEFNSTNWENVPNSEPTKPTKGSFVGFVGSVSDGFSENSGSDCIVFTQDFPSSFDEIREERIAIMMFDGGLSEADAIRYVIENSGF